MKKVTLLFAILVCLLDVSGAFGFSGNDEGKSSSGRSKLRDSGRSAKLGNTKSGNKESSGKAMKADKKLSGANISKVKKAEERFKSFSEFLESLLKEIDGLATLPNGPAYVRVNSSLNLRDGVWGTIIGSLFNNEKITITGRDGDWYKVSTSKGNGYAHADYIVAAPNSNDTSSSSKSDSNKTNSNDNVVLNVSGDSLQGKIVSAAHQLVENYPGYQSFPYAAGTEGGNLGCAQVATTVLCAAGALPATNSSGGLGYASLAVDVTVDLLKDAGWVSVKVPPYQAGDVVAWNDYGHIGIIMTSGNTAEAMHNSSSKRKPCYIEADYFEITEVLRKS